MRAVDFVVMRGFLILVRGQRHRQDGHARIQSGAHQAINHGLGHEIVTIDTSVHDKGGAGDGTVLAGGGQIAGQQGHFERAGHIEHINLIDGNQFKKAIQCPINDVGMPVGLDERIAGVCHLSSPLVTDTSPKAITNGQARAAHGPVIRFSFIRTITVGSGIAPDLLTLSLTGARGLEHMLLPPVGTFTLP